MASEILSGNIVSDASGIGAALCLTCGPAFRDRSAILAAQFGAGMCFATHYLCLGLTVAAATSVLGVVQTGAAMRAPESRSMTRLGYALIGLMVLSGFMFWQGSISAFSILAMSLIALGRLQSDTLRLRVLILSGGIVWMVHDFVGHAWIALIADVGAFITGVAALIALGLRAGRRGMLFTPTPSA